MNFFQFIVQDWKANKGNPKGRIILVLFRTANFFSQKRIYRYIGFPYLMFYRILVEWFFSIEIPWNVKIGKGFILYHGQATVFNNQVVIGENCTIRQSTTIGNKTYEGGLTSKSPVIGNNVDIGCSVIIIGDITIGDNAKIGAGSVVVKNVSNNSVVVGNPAREINSTKKSL